MMTSTTAYSEIERVNAMATGSVKIEIPFEALEAAVASLSIEEKHRLMAILDAQLLQEEGDPEEEEAVAEARRQIEAGEYVTLDDYVAGERTP